MEDPEMVSFNSSPTVIYEGNQSDVFIGFNHEMNELVVSKLEQKDRELSLFRYMYHLCAVLIVICNGLVLLSVLLSKKRRRHFQHWLILHVIIIHILVGGVVCPFQGESLVENRAALSVVFCKLLHFLSDLLGYMSNVSIALLGIDQCMCLFSPQMLDTVSRTLLTTMLIIVPWIVCTMLTTVLRITMSEEQYGLCYKIDDKTAQILWLLFGNGIPFFINIICFFVIIIILCTNIVITSSNTNNKQRINVFICVCLCSSVLMRAPFMFIFSQPLYEEFKKKLYAAATNSALETAERIITLYRVTVLFDMLRLINLILIPLVYLIPSEVRRLCSRIRTKMFCRTVDCNSTVKKQSLEMVSMTHVDKSQV